MTKIILFRPLATNLQQGYSNFVQQKAVGLALVGYKLVSVQSAMCGFFVRIISMHSHISMAKLGRDTSTCAGILTSLSTNPFQLCHPHLVVTGKAPKQTQGAYSS